jgi:D-amino-acid oxidase
MRKGGLRLEKEVMPFMETGLDGFSNIYSDLNVIHAYGAGGSGYKISWGVAYRVMSLVSGEPGWWGNVGL